MPYSVPGAAGDRPFLDPDTPHLSKRSAKRQGTANTGRHPAPLTASAHLAEQDKAEHDAGHQAGRDQPLAGSGKATPGDLAPAPAQPVPRGQPDHLAQVTDDVHGHGAEPQHEAGLVHLQQQRQPRPAHQQQPDAAEQQHQGEDHHDRAEQAQQHRRRPLAPVGRGTGVVAGEPPGRAGHLDQHRRDEHHADEHMRREQLAHAQDRDALRRQQHQQHRGVSRRQAGVAGRARIGPALGPAPRAAAVLPGRTARSAEATVPAG
jgi:hypothetical protein